MKGFETFPHIEVSNGPLPMTPRVVVLGVLLECCSTIKPLNASVFQPISLFASLSLSLSVFCLSAIKCCLSILSACLPVYLPLSLYHSVSLSASLISLLLPLSSFLSVSPASLNQFLQVPISSYKFRSVPTSSCLHLQP